MRRVLFAAALAATVFSACSSGGSPTAIPRAFDGVSRDLTFSAASVPQPMATALVKGEIQAGAGFSDSSPHQIVRSSANVLYVSVPSCGAYPACPGNVLAMQANVGPGNPRSFVERDAAHRPKSPTSKDAIGSSALAIDGNDVIWVAYNTRNYGTHVIDFDTKQGRWGRDVRIGTSSAGAQGQVSQGKEGVAIAVDASGAPHVVYSFFGTDGQKHVAMSTYAGGMWKAPVQIDDRRIPSGYGTLHPTIAYTPAGVLLVAWLVGDENVGYNEPDGTIIVRAIEPAGKSPASVEIPDTIAKPNTGYAATTIDQGPTLLVTADGVAHITYIDTTDAIRYWYTDGKNYTRWLGNRQPAHQLTHDPALGPDGNGGLYIYGHGTPMGNQNGHGNYLYRMHLASNATTWTPFEMQIGDTNVDSSVSTRWSQFFDRFPQQVDYTYWDDHYPNLELVTDH